MFDLALSVAACLRSGTRADVAWIVEPFLPDQAVALTPGGGRIGSLANGAFDGILAEVVSVGASTGRRIDHTVTAVEAAVSGLPEGSPATLMVAPAAQFPVEAWPILAAREPLILAVDTDGQVISSIGIVALDDAPESVRDAVVAGRSTLVRTDDRYVVALVPATKLLVAGRGDIADALAVQGELLGWQVVVDPRPEAIVGLAATLSPRDAFVVMGHDVESSSRCLMAALESDAGYIGALGSQAMQQARADWLAYRDVHDTGRVHGPAGVNIGAKGPAEIAVSIAAEAIAVLRS